MTHGHPGIKTESLVLNDGVIMVSSPLLEIPQCWPITASASSYFTVIVLRSRQPALSQMDLDERKKKKKSKFLCGKYLFIKVFLYVSIQRHFVGMQTLLHKADYIFRTPGILYFSNYGCMWIICNMYVFIFYLAFTIFPQQLVEGKQLTYNQKNPQQLC